MGQDLDQLLFEAPGQAQRASEVHEQRWRDCGRAKKARFANRELHFVLCIIRWGSPGICIRFLDPFYYDTFWTACSQDAGKQCRHPGPSPLLKKPVLLTPSGGSVGLCGPWSLNSHRSCAGSHHRKCSKRPSCAYTLSRASNAHASPPELNMPLVGAK